MIDRRTFKGDAMVLVAVVTWALAYPIAKDALDRERGWGEYVCSFNAARFWVAFVVLSPAVLWGYGLRLRKFIWPSICVGGSLVVSYLCQSLAYAYTSAGTVAFVTALSVVLVPIWSSLHGKPITAGTATGIVLATVGLAFMCLTTAFTIDLGVLLAFLGAVGFAADIVLIGKFKHQTEDPDRRVLSGLTFVAMQSLVVALAMTLLALIFEVPAGLPDMTWNAGAALLYLVIVATCLGFTLQAIGQRSTTDVRVALISTLEAVIAAVAAYFILGEEFSTPMLVGAGLILLGTGLSEVSTAMSGSPGSGPVAEDAVDGQALTPHCDEPLLSGNLVQSTGGE